MNTASGASFRRAKGGDDDDTGFGEVLYSWLRVMDGKKEAVVNFSSELSEPEGSVPISFSCFICKHNERGVTSVLERLPIAIAPSPPTVMLGKPVEKKEQFISVPTI